MFTLLGDEAVPALLDVVVARLLFSPLFRGDERLDVALTAATRRRRSPGNTPALKIPRTVSC